MPLQPVLCQQEDHGSHYHNPKYYDGREQDERHRVLDTSLLVLTDMAQDVLVPICGVHVTYR